MIVKRCVWLVFILFAVHNLIAQDMLLRNYAFFILPHTLERHVAILASDSLQGREVGTPGGWMAGDYIAGCFEQYGLKAPYDGSYYQVFDTLLPAQNVVGVLEGTDKNEEAVIIGAHYDHHGMGYYSVYNGADDNASGVAAMLEIAKTLSEMGKSGYKPRRTVIFIAYDAKERSMSGSEWYAQHPLTPLNHTIACFNIDMIGRADVSPANDTNYVLIVGLDKHPSDLKQITDYVNIARGVNLYIDYSFYNSELFKELFYQMSDQYSFGERGIPVIYYTSGMHDDLWKPSDDIDKLSFPVLQKRTQLIFYTLWEMVK